MPVLHANDYDDTKFIGLWQAMNQVCMPLRTYQNELIVLSLI